VPVFNEDPATFVRCLQSLQSQSLRPARVFVVDDGSVTRACYEAALAFAAHDPTVTVHRFDANQGKRHAQAWGFRQASTDVVVTVDSDTVLHPDAILELVRPLGDARVSGVCGYARGLNRKRTLLTRLIDLRYTNSFLYERAAYSVLGSVLCSTGVLSAYRRDVVMDNIDDYLDQTFLGTEVHYGDDRRLTAYGLRRGRVVLQDSAIALTTLPERLPQFVRQQVRWNKSFFRESLLLLRQSRPTRIAWWLGGAELGYWMILTTMLLWSVVIRPLITQTPPTWQYAAFVALMAYARSIRMIGDRGRLFPLSFLLAPLYGFLNLVLLVPLRFYSLLRLRDGSWGTRKRRRGVRRGEHTEPVLPIPAPTAATVPVAAIQVPGQVPGERVDDLPPVVAPAPVATGRPCVDILAG
jgi:hyaluronan synthase